MQELIQHRKDNFAYAPSKFTKHDAKLLDTVATFAAIEAEEDDTLAKIANMYNANIDALFYMNKDRLPKLKRTSRLLKVNSLVHIIVCILTVTHRGRSFYCHGLLVQRRGRGCLSTLPLFCNDCDVHDFDLMCRKSPMPRTHMGCCLL